MVVLELIFYKHFSDSIIELIMPIALLYTVIIMINNVSCDHRNVTWKDGVVLTASESNIASALLEFQSNAYP